MSMLQVGNRVLPLNSDRTGRLRPTDIRSCSNQELQTRLAQDGYLYLPNLIPRALVLAGQAAITARLEAATGR